MMIVASLLACTPSSPQGARRDAPASATDTAATAYPEDAADSEHSGVMEDSATDEEASLLPPTTVLVPGPDLEILGVQFLAPFADDPPLLLVHVEWLSSHDRTHLLLPGPLPPGEHAVQDLWDGVSTAPFPIVTGGDEDGDGVRDVWSGGRRYDQSLLGNALEEGTVTAALPGDWRTAMLSHDLDQDGTLDLLDSTGLIHFGPLAGDLPEQAREEGGQIQLLRANESALVQPNAGPDGRGRLVVSEHNGSWHTRLYDLPLDRNVTPPIVGAVATIDEKEWYGVRQADPGDLDGDGIAELLVGAGELDVLLGPVTVDDPSEPAVLPLAELEKEHLYVRAAPGDLNGDGTREMVLLTIPGGGTVLWLSPFDVPRSAAATVPLDAGYLQPVVHGDLDSDGLEDLAVVVDDDTVSIWTGSALRGAARPTP